MLVDPNFVKIVKDPNPKLDQAGGSGAINLITFEGNTDLSIKPVPVSHKESTPCIQNGPTQCDQSSPKSPPYHHPFDALIDSEDDELNSDYMEGYDQNWQPYMNKKMRKRLAMKKRIKEAKLNPNESRWEWRPVLKKPKAQSYRMLKKVMPPCEIATLIRSVSEHRVPTSQSRKGKEINVIGNGTKCPSPDAYITKVKSSKPNQKNWCSTPLFFKKACEDDSKSPKKKFV